METFEWKTVSASIIVDKNESPATYGLVRRNGKVFYRNYKRKLKRGGISLLDIYEKKVSDRNRRVIEDLNISLYASI